jgi:hypothetical protein
VRFWEPQAGTFLGDATANDLSAGEMTVYGYARVSTGGQTLDAKIAALKATGASPLLGCSRMNLVAIDLLSGVEGRLCQFSKAQFRSLRRP